MRIVVAVLMTVFLSLGTVCSLFAEEGKDSRGKGAAREEILKKFDKDGDGKLNDEEKAAAKAAKAEMEKQMLEKYDKDKDGKLSDEEKAEMKKVMAERKAKHDAGGEKK